MRHFVSLFFPSPPEIAAAIVGALAPEANSAEVPKTRGEARVDAGGFTVEMWADDVPSLRAAVNSYLRWVDAAEKAARLGLAR